MKRKRIKDDGVVDARVETSRRDVSAFSKFVYAVFIINVLGLLLLLVGLFAGWFRIGGDRVADGSYRFGLVFDAKEVRDDIDATMKEASDLAATAKSASSLNTYNGQVKSLDKDAQTLVLVNEGKDYTIHFSDATKFESQGISSLGDLNVGDPLRLTTQDEDGRLFAVKVRKVALDDVQVAPK